MTITIDSLLDGGTSNIIARDTFTSVESALSPVKLEPNRGALNIQKTGLSIGGFFDDLFGPGTVGEGKTTEQQEQAVIPGISFNQQLIGALIIGALVLGFLFMKK